MAPTLRRALRLLGRGEGLQLPAVIRQVGELADDCIGCEIKHRVAQRGPI